jgi:ParB-like chromosome segregation protein Spo0J
MTNQIEMALIYKGERSRPIVKENVEHLMQSMSDVGLINPICVKKVSRYHAGIIRDCYEIVAGGHRYAAAVKLGWSMISATVVDADDILYELAEIDENLIRANLSPAETAMAIARRKEIYETIHPETKHGAIGGGHTRVAENATLHVERFTKATAEAIGKAERTVQLMAERGKKIGKDLHDVVGTSLDNVRDLDALAKMVSVFRFAKSQK